MCVCVWCCVVEAHRTPVPKETTQNTKSNFSQIAHLFPVIINGIYLINQCIFKIVINQGCPNISYCTEN